MTYKVSFNSYKNGAACRSIIKLSSVRCDNDVYSAHSKQSLISKLRVRDKMKHMLLLLHLRDRSTKYVTQH